MTNKRDISKTTLSPCAICYGAGALRKTVDALSLDDTPNSVWCECTCCGARGPIMKKTANAIAGWNWLNKDPIERKLLNIINDSPNENQPVATCKKQINKNINKLSETTITTKKKRIRRQKPDNTLIPVAVTSKPLEKPKRKRRTKAEMEEARLQEALLKRQSTQTITPKKRGRPVGWRKNKCR